MGLTRLANARGHGTAASIVIRQPYTRNIGLEGTDSPEDIICEHVHVAAHVDARVSVCGLYEDIHKNMVGARTPIIRRLDTTPPTSLPISVPRPSTFVPRVGVELIYARYRC